MARVNPKYEIKDRTQAEAALSRINAIDLELTGMDLAEAKEIGAVRAAHALAQQKSGRALTEAEKALLLKDLKHWAESDCGHWKEKTLSLSLGQIGFRMSNPAVCLYKKAARTLAEALELLNFRMPSYTRISLAINKEKILAEDREDKLDREKLKKCGLTVSQKDEFWVETLASKDLEKAVKALKNA